MTLETLLPLPAFLTPAAAADSGRILILSGGSSGAGAVGGSGNSDTRFSVPFLGRPRFGLRLVVVGAVVVWWTVSWTVSLLLLCLKMAGWK